MCDPRNLCPGPDCAHDRADDTWLTPTDLRPTFREPAEVKEPAGGDNP